MMEVGEVRYYYLRKQANGGSMPFGCVAFRRNGDGTVNRGVSLCSTRDNFNRQHARGLALKRLLDAEKAGLATYFQNYGHPSCRCRQNPLVLDYVENEDSEYKFLHEDGGSYFSGQLGENPTGQEKNIIGIAGRR